MQAGEYNGVLLKTFTLNALMVKEVALVGGNKMFMLLLLWLLLLLQERFFSHLK